MYIETSLLQISRERRKTRFENFDRALRSLQADLRAQQTVTNEIKQKTTIFFKGMRTFSSQSNQSFECEKNLLASSKEGAPDQRRRADVDS